MELNKLGGRFTQSLKSLAVCLVAIVILLCLSTTAGAEAAEHDSNLPSVTVYRDPDCHCCGGWIDHLTAQGFHPENVSTPDMGPLKQTYGVPEALTSCHTAIIDGYVIEGHVPIADIKRLLADRPELVGLTVPGMPIGTPGMESESGSERESFTVFSFDAQGNPKEFNQYSF